MNTTVVMVLDPMLQPKNHEVELARVCRLLKNDSLEPHLFDSVSSSVHAGDTGQDRPACVICSPRRNQTVSRHT